MQIAITSNLDDIYLEKRDSERHVGVILIAKIESIGTQSVCRIRNISAKGAQIETNIPLKFNQLVALELRSDLKLTGRVRWKKGVYAGLQFDKPIDLTRYLLRPESKIDRIKVRAPRYECHAEAVAIADIGNFRCVVSDVSLSGACISNLPSKVKLKPNQTVRFRCDGLPVRQACIVWVDCDRLGLNFRHPIKYTELQDWLTDYSRPSLPPSMLQPLRLVSSGNVLSRH